MAAAGIVLLVLFAGFGGYSLGRRNRSRQPAARFDEACADGDGVPLESRAESQGASLRIGANR